MTGTQGRQGRQLVSWRRVDLPLTLRISDQPTHWIREAGALSSALGALARDAEYAILERDAETFVQACREGPDAYRLEIHERAGAHYECAQRVTYRDVERCFVRFLEGRDVRGDAEIALRWRPLVC